MTITQFSTLSVFVAMNIMENYLQYISYYNSPLGNILLAADDTGLTGLWFCGQKHFPIIDKDNWIEKETNLLNKTKDWLDIYFSGKNPSFIPELHLTGTPFQISVWNILQKIHYGETTSYNKISEILLREKNIAGMSPRAVGGAVGKNKISLIIPCHRVLGTNGGLTGYAGGINRKAKLLELERTGSISP